MRALFVALGAGVGAPARFAIDQYLRKFSTKPYGTLLVNVLGSFVIGLTFSTSEKAHDLLAIGFAGAFTTWSTFTLDLYLAWKLKKYAEALINLSVSIGLGLLAVSIGLALTN
ncbi:unannotated protein [freshwater metagenome]|uniref:Unannotated protein n=1 Tax=freshwater metagenome TaxID=449393 RepID=A0A6J7XZ86_9ZZZZ|nr:hypothetical protein [Actinomycetota bacterium]